MDLVCAGFALVLFALFHHVLPRQQQSLGITVSNSVSSEKSTEASVTPDPEPAGLIASTGINDVSSLSVSSADDRQTGSLGFDPDDGKTFQKGRKNKNIHRLQIVMDIGHHTLKDHILLQTFFHSFPAQFCFLFAFTDQQQLHRIGFFLQQGKNL